MSDQPFGDRDLVANVARLVRLLGDPTRLRLLAILQPGERNVTALCRQLELAQPTVSHHLGLLRSAGMVRTRRSGKQIFYSLNPDQVSGEGQGLRISTELVSMQLGVGPERPTHGATANGHGNGAIVVENVEPSARAL